MDAVQVQEQMFADALEYGMSFSNCLEDESLDSDVRSALLQMTIVALEV